MTGILESSLTRAAGVSKDTSAGIARLSAGRGTVAATLLLLALPVSSVHAACNDEPGPGVDWSECQKSAADVRLG